MAVTINLKNSDNALTTLAKAAKCSGWGAQLVAVGASVNIQPKSLQILRAGATLATASLNTEALNLWVGNKLHESSMKVLQTKVEEVFRTAMKALEDQGVLIFSEGDKDDSDAADKSNILVGVPDEAEATNTLDASILLKPDSDDDDEIIQTKKKPAKSKAGKVETTGVTGAETSPGFIDSSTPILLKNATNLYQPVKASSQGSVYHTVAISDQIKVAARIKASGDAYNLSCRFEGVGLKDVAQKLAEAGVQVSGGYASIHLHGQGGKQNALRALGAVLFATRIPFAKVVSDPAALFNKGA